MVQKLSFIYISTLFLFSSVLSAETSDSISLQKKYKPQVIFGMGGAISTTAGDFKDTYSLELNPTEKDFEETPIIFAGFKMLLNEHFRIAANLYYFNSSFNDFYDETVQFGSEPTSRSIQNDINIQTFPILLSLEYLPYRGQFKSYFGVSGGVSLNDIEWEETLVSTTITDPRKGGIHIQSSSVTPAIKFYTGVDLGFDQKKENYLLNSLIIEIGYLHIFRREDIFGNIKEQFINVPESFNREYWILPGYLTMNVALSLNIYHDKLK